MSGHRVLGFLATAPIAIPGIVLGVGLFLSLYAAAVRALRHALDFAGGVHHHRAAGRLPADAVGVPRHHPELEDASRILGATRLQALRQITAPLLRTCVIATWCFIFVGVIRELSAAIMLFTSETKVISVLIFDLNESGDLGAISVLGLIMLVITFAVVITVNRIPGFGGTGLRNT